MEDEKVVEKTSRWTEAEREADAAPPPKPPTVPAWVYTFRPGTVFTHEGWDCVVRHIGCEEGHWLMLVEPMLYTPPRAVSRSEYRRLVAQVGKKKARQIIKERKAEVVGGEPSDPSEDAGA